MKDSFTRQQIATATGLPSERIRYVIDQKILPGDRQTNALTERRPGRGVARSYTAFEAFGIACAAAMISAGLRRQTVINCFSLLCNSAQSGRSEIKDIPLFEAFEKRDVAMLEVGDHINVRIRGSDDTRKRKLNCGWRQIETGAQLINYEPLVVVSINASLLRKCFN